jgi:hypothetical protein
VTPLPTTIVTWACMSATVPLSAPMRAASRELDLLLEQPTHVDDAEQKQQEKRHDDRHLNRGRAALAPGRPRRCGVGAGGVRFV